MSAWLLLDVFEWFHSISTSAFEFGVQSLLSVFSYNIFCQHRVRRLQPTALATAASRLAGEEIGPLAMCQWAFDNGCCAEEYGSYHSLIPEGGRFGCWWYRALSPNLFQRL